MAVPTIADPPRARAVLLGASNLSRSLAPAVDVARERLGTPSEILVAAGRGRSYGTRSSFLGRSLPAIVDCGLWRRLEQGPPAPLSALVGDVGNDLVYGAPVDAIAGWIETCVERLERAGAEIALGALPLENLRHLSPAAFRFFRALFFTGRAPDRLELIARAEELDARLRDLAERRGLARVEVRPDWYGLDPIHHGLLRRRRALEDLLASWSAPAGAPEDAARVARGGLGLSPHWTAPEQRWLLGFEQRGAQPVRRLRCGSTLWLY